ncbi:hypothetical protein A359_04030 [secondary endosymbiont of Ctenarytaina eucalypti]|uniref:Uncharacterized protein n=1 Tax=secondary endosymbiont of Ctenarytaina eucalypti TaxID=1199245 RepID=J3VS39_9ENTR|nr:hypothetical protein A359_04030 [secondary endosymbiont of Ctenarytaina eucalypti]
MSRAAFGTRRFPIFFSRERALFLSFSRGVCFPFALRFSRTFFDGFPVIFSDSSRVVGRNTAIVRALNNLLRKQLISQVIADNHALPREK